ncbi:MAG TPA: signal recognition particle-docking protein FtsY [Thermoanaerobaculia bacterium]|nr:signal recognition particle-docking protein FtsY [Thermoanaerobaculia bacterium]
MSDEKSIPRSTDPTSPRPSTAAPPTTGKAAAGTDVLELAPERRLPEEPEKKNFWGKLKRGLTMTHTELIDRMSAAMEGRATVDEDTLEFLEEVLIQSDLGVETSLELVERLREDVRPNEAMDVFKLRQRLVDEMSVLLLDAPRPPQWREQPGGAPRLTLVVGVNGVGKTTSIAKLARRSQAHGERVLLAAGDTFRAAAIEQLELWGQRLGIEVVRSAAGGDPAAVVYDAIQAARARRIDHVLVDTAGRLHTKEHLMKELGKIGRVVEREAGDWQRRTLLVLDATTGQNAISQARTFTQVVPVDGVLLAKIDGTAKGGMAVAVARELRLPVLYLGVGEKAEDLVEFRPREFASALLG